VADHGGSKTRASRGESGVFSKTWQTVVNGRLAEGEELKSNLLQGYDLKCTLLTLSEVRATRANVPELAEASP
jgi:hypothetical protein